MPRRKGALSCRRRTSGPAAWSAAAPARAELSCDTPAAVTLPNELGKSSRDPLKRCTDQFRMPGRVNPAAGAGRMRQRDHNWRAWQFTDAELAANLLGERLSAEESFDGKPPDENDHPGRDELDLRVQPRRA